MAVARPLLRPLPLVLAGLVLLLLAADTGLWLWATRRMSQILTEWEAAQQAAGLHVVHGVPVRAGWPVAAELRLPHVAIAATEQQTPSAWSWQADTVTLIVAPLHPTILQIQPSGPQILALGEASLPVSAVSLDLQIPLSDDQGSPARARAQGLRVGLPSGVLAVAEADMQFDASHLTVSAQDLVLPVPNLPFGGMIAAIAMTASTNVPLPLQGDLHGAAAAWRDAGGRLLVEHAAIRWGPLDAAASGALTLDLALQPRATAALHLTGYAELTEALARTGAISRNDARVGATLLGLMAHTPAGAPPFVDVPLTVQDGLVSAGAIPLIKLPRFLPP